MPSAIANPKVVWLCEDCESEGDGSFYYGSIAQDGICARCGRLAMMVYDKATQEPRRAPMRRFGPATFSTSLAVTISPFFIWDQARYYADLGVSPRATRREIRDAYLGFGSNPSPRQTYIVKQLLNPVVRERYDNCPLGVLWFDRFVLAHVYAEMAKDLSEVAIRTPDALEAAERVDLSEYLDRPFEVVLDEGSLDGQDDDATWRWGYYLWQSGSKDTPRLRWWQEHLVQALAEREGTYHIAVGFLGKHMACAWEVSVVGNHVVVFLNEDTLPTAALAIQAADRVVTTT